MLARVFHASVSGYYLWLNYQSYQLVTALYNSREDVYASMTAGGLELFTVWTQIFQQIYFYVCFALDILHFATDDGHAGLKAALNTVKLYMYPCLVLPSALIAPVNFWSIYALAPHLVDDRGIMNLYVLPWYNHCLHTNVAPIALLELLVSSRVYPSRAVGLLAIPLMLIAYCIIIFVCYFVGNTWPYPLFALMNNGHRLAYFFSNCALGLLAYLLGDIVNTAMWGQQTGSYQMEPQICYIREEAQTEENRLKKSN